MATGEHLLRSATSWQRRQGPAAARLGTDVECFMKYRLTRLRRGSPVVDAWYQIVPAEIADNCRITGITDTTLYVEAQPGPWMHELGLAAETILQNIRQQCPQSRIKKIHISALRLPEGK